MLGPPINSQSQSYTRTLFCRIRYVARKFQVMNSNKLRSLNIIEELKTINTMVYIYRGMLAKRIPDKVPEVTKVLLLILQLSL